MEKNPYTIHFVGIGGIGMSALARYFLSQGWRVQGSDLTASPITAGLIREGVMIYIGKHAANKVTRNVLQMVYTRAVPHTHPELVKARALGIAVEAYPEVVGELTRQYKTIAIAGSHGKSTTTAMTALILEAGGLDPTVILGTLLPQFGNTNFRKGGGQWLVLEADEYRASFLHYFPTLAGITNIDAEHLDFYKTFANVKKTFADFKKQAQKVIAPVRDARTRAAIRQALAVPGAHNVENAALAYAIGRALTIPHATILKGLRNYKGAWRRMEYKGTTTISRIKYHVYDDYGHHPTEIEATLAAFREKLPKTPLICVFQPHQAKRLRALFPAFTAAFGDADHTIILPSYEVAGRDAKETQRYSAKALARKINAAYVSHPSRGLHAALKKIAGTLPASSAPTLVMMGAGTINQLTEKLFA